MKKILTNITLAAATILLLGSCAKINERIDDLEGRINGLKSEEIASIDTQITSINSSIADLGTIRTNIQNLTATTAAQAQDIKDLNNEDTEIGKKISDLKKADESINKRIDDLQKYVNDTLKAYGTKEWVEATFSTLAQYEETCDTIAKIDARIGALDSRLSQSIEDCADSLKAWVNVQLDGYYTIAQMDAKVAEMNAQIDTLRGENEAKADSLKAEIVAAKAELDTVKANIRTEYKAAIETAITELDGKLSNELQTEIAQVNLQISNLTTSVNTLQSSINALTGRVTALEAMIQSVVIVPAYSDGSVKSDKDSLYIDFIVSPADAVENLAKNNVKLLINTVKTKAVNVVTVDLAENDVFEKDEANGAISVRAYIADKLPESIDSTITVAVKVQNGISKYTTDFSPVTTVTAVLDAESVQEAKNFITQSDDYLVKKVNLTEANITQDDVNLEDQTIHFVLKTTSPVDLVSFELPKIPTGINCNGWTIEYEENYPTRNVDVNAPEGTKVTILTPTSHVTVTGTSYAEITALTGDNTLVIPEGVTVDKLIAKKGAFEIHGTVTSLEISPEDGNNVCFRDCEGLSQKVFDVIKGSSPSEHDYIDRPSYTEKKNENNTWDITYSCKIGNKTYGTIEDAFNNVKNGETIVMHQNDVLTKGQTITLENNEAFTLDLNGKTVSIAETGFDFTANGTNVALRDGVPVRFAIVVNGNGTMNICDNSTDKLGRLETKNYSYGTTKTILVDGNAIVNVNSGTIAADYAAFYVVGYTGTTAVPANAPKPTLNVNGGKILGQKNGIGIKGNTATLKVTGGEIVGNEYYAVSTNGTQDWYDGGKFAIEITGGLIKSVDGCAMYLPAEGPTVITGGTFEGATGIAVKGGSLSISDNAVVKATGPFVTAQNVSSGNANTGSAIYVEDTYSNHAPIVNISGGKFSSVNNKAVEYFTNKADDATDKGKITLTGGLYSDQPEASFIAENHEVVSNSDETYTYKVQQKPPVVKIGGVEYADIADAFAAVPTDGTATTVTLLDNIGSKSGDEIVWKEYNQVYAYTINKGQNVTFDLNGHKIYGKTTVNGETCFFRVENGGNLTIQDSSVGGELNYLDGNDNNGGFTICSAGNLTIKSGKIENHTNCVNSSIQGAIDVHANEWGTPYAHHVTFTMNGGILKSKEDNTLRIYDSSQTGKGTVVFDFEINGGEIYGADAIFIMTQWTKTYCTGDTYMNNINVSVKGGTFVTSNGIRVVGNVGEANNKDYKAIKINVSGGQFTNLANNKYRENNVAFQNSGNWESNESATGHLRSYTDVSWTAAVPSHQNNK